MSEQLHSNDQLQFDFKLLQLKHQKFQIEYVKAKAAYEERIVQLEQENEAQKKIIDDGELKVQQLRDQMSELLELYNNKRKEVVEQVATVKKMEEQKNELHSQIVQIQAQKSNEELRRVQLADQNQGLIKEISSLGQLKQTGQRQQKEDYGLACELMRAFCGQNISTSSISFQSYLDKQIDQDEQLEKLNLLSLVERCIQEVARRSQSKIEEAILMWEARFNRCCSNVSKLKLRLTKLKMEKDFYKRLHRKYQLQDTQNLGFGDEEELLVSDSKAFLDSTREWQQAKNGGVQKYPQASLPVLIHQMSISSTTPTPDLPSEHFISSGKKKQGGPQQIRYILKSQELNK